MNLMKLAARGPAPWASEPVAPQLGPLGAVLRSPTTDLLCDLSDLHPLRASEWCADSAGKSGAAGLPQPPQSLLTAAIQGRSGSEAFLTPPLPLGCPSWVSPPIHILWSRTSMSPPPGRPL